MEDSLLRLNVKLKGDMHPLLYESLQKLSKTDRVQRLLSLALVGLLTERGSGLAVTIPVISKSTLEAVSSTEMPSQVVVASQVVDQQINGRKETSMRGNVSQANPLAEQVATDWANPVLEDDDLDGLFKGLSVGGRNS